MARITTHHLLLTIFGRDLAAIGVAAFCAALAVATAAARAETNEPTASASSTLDGSDAGHARDGNRFDTGTATAWMGRPGETKWWWQVDFSSQRPIGAILQIVGDDPLILRNAPRSYIWQTSDDGSEWSNLDETRAESEQRTFRLHRLKQPREARYLRLVIDRVEGEFPTLREVEVFAASDAAVDFPDFVVAVSTVEKDEGPGEFGGGREFVPLARKCPGWEALQAQHVGLRSFNEAFAAAEPRPLCAFLSGNFSDWCQKDREVWRGVEQVFRGRHLPIWASCGGAQGLAIINEVGCDNPWDCPHCRDPNDPKLPIYTHIGHTAERPCGDYSCCLDERGPFGVVQLARDPAFAGLPREFQVMEGHCGQIEYVPKGWVQIATHGTLGKTRMQCLRVADRYIYAAQFHIEMAGTPDVSRRIMGNFLQLAKSWGGYNPDGQPPAEP
jgi:hypothetical protein